MNLESIREIQMADPATTEAQLIQDTPLYGLNHHQGRLYALSQVLDADNYERLQLLVTDIMARAREYLIGFLQTYTVDYGLYANAWQSFMKCLESYRQLDEKLILTRIDIRRNLIPSPPVNV